jgi:uncharacterized Zn finger protein
MGLTIKKSYEENVQLKPFHFVKVGIEISSDKVLTTPGEVEITSIALNKMARNLVRKDLATIKKQSEQGEE